MIVSALLSVIHLSGQQERDKMSQASGRAPI